MKRLLALASALLIVWACSDGIPSGPQETPQGPTGYQLVTPDSTPGKCHLESTDFVTMHGCPSTSATSLPMMHQCQINCHQSYPQPDPTHIVFSRPVYEVDVISGGQYPCGTSDKGQAQYYSGRRVVETGVLVLTDSIVECETPDTKGGLDSIAQSVAYHSTYKGHIDSIVISRPQPDSMIVDWPPYDTDSTRRIQDVSANYSVFLFEQRPATATNCLTKDPFLDQQSIRDLFHTLWADSSGVSGPANLRREVYTGVFEDSVTGALVFQRSPTIPGETPCKGNPSMTQAPGTYLTFVHVHPFNHQLEQEPANCHPNRPANLPPLGWDDSTRAGVSLADWQTLATSPQPIPMYIIDSMHVHIVPTNATPANAMSTVRVLARYNALDLCTIF